VISTGIVVLLEAGFDGRHVTPGYDVVDQTVAAAVDKIGFRVVQFQVEGIRYSSRSKNTGSTPGFSCLYTPVVTSGQPLSL
jgi:hypothetical protein